MSSSIKPTGRVFASHHGSERWTSSTPGSTFSNTGPAHHFNFNGKIGCIVACALVMPSENSHEIRAPDFGLQATSLSRTKIVHIASAAPSFALAPNYGTRPAIITGGSARSPPTPRQPPNTSASWTSPDQSSSSSLLPGTIRLLERNVTRGAFKLVKVDSFSKESCATSTSPEESNLPTPSRPIDVPGSGGWFSTGIDNYW